MSNYKVSYAGKNIQGNLRPRKNTFQKPNVHYTKSPQEFSTLLIWDPDAPAKSWAHWLVINIPGSQISHGQEILRYEPPNPPSGIHHYYVTLYNQPGIIKVPIPSQRGNFNVTSFENKYGLTKFGEKMVQVSA
jgi:phosphatidylethanolamine-binding protein (PEBP) family uncharacterized protein